MSSSWPAAVLVLLILGVAAAPSAPAAYVVLENGDRVSGEILVADREALVVKSSFMGEVKGDWSAIVEIHSDEQLYLQSDDGQVLTGAVRTKDKEFQVQTAHAGPVAVPIAAVAAVRSETSQQAHETEIERLRDPSLLDFWSGYFDAGYSLAQGNARSSTLATSSQIQRKTQRDKISIHYNQIFSRNRVDGGETETTANAIRGGTRYDIDIGKKLFTFAFLDLEADEFQDLDLRAVLGGGLGYHVVQSENLTFDVFAGGSFNQEFFSTDLTRRSGEIVLGEESVWTISDRTNWTQRLAVYPNVSDRGSYRMQFDTALSTKLNNWLAWQITFSDRFLSNPVPGRQKNDVLPSTGLRVNFGRDQ